MKSFIKVKKFFCSLGRGRISGRSAVLGADLAPARRQGKDCGTSLALPGESQVCQVLVQRFEVPDLQAPAFKARRHIPAICGESDRN